MLFGSWAVTSLNMHEQAWLPVRLCQRCCVDLINIQLRKCGTTVGLRGATVARLTPDQKVACSNHVGVMGFIFQKSILYLIK